MIEKLTKVEISLLLEPLHGELHLHDLTVQLLQLSSRGPSGPVSGPPGRPSPRCPRWWCRRPRTCRGSLGHARHGRPPSARLRLAGASNLFPSSHGQGVVVLPPVVGVEEFLEPLDKLEIILQYFSFQITPAAICEV